MHGWQLLKPELYALLSAKIEPVGTTNVEAKTEYTEADRLWLAEAGQALLSLDGRTS